MSQRSKMRVFANPGLLLLSRTIIVSWALYIRRIFAQVHVKDIIDGHLYDTRTSILIGEREERGSFMYKTGNGEFFIYHASPMANRDPSWINPISKSVAIRRHFRYSHNQMAFEQAFCE